MNWDELLESTALGKDVIVTVIKPLRKEEYYKAGRMTGYKSGLYGGGHSNYRNGVPCSYDASKRRWIKKPKVHVTYNVFTYGGKEHSDWISVDNCIFEIRENG